MLIYGGVQVEEFTYEGGDIPAGSSLSIALTEDPSQYAAIDPPPAPPPAWTIDVWVRTTTGKFALGRHREQSPSPTSTIPHARIIATAYCPGALQWYVRIDGREWPVGVQAEVELSALLCCASYGVRRVPFLDTPIVSHSGRLLSSIVTARIIPRNFRRERARVWNADPLGFGSILAVNAEFHPVALLAPGQSIDVRASDEIDVTDGGGASAATASWWEESDG